MPFLHFLLITGHILQKYRINFCILSLKVKEWLQNLGIGEHMPVVHDEDEADDVNVPPQSDDNSIRNR